MKTESEDKTRMAWSKQFLAHCQEAENQARVALAQAVEATKRARIKHDELFEEVEKRAVARILAAQ